jgi:hypothetical protein
LGFWGFGVLNFLSFFLPFLPFLLFSSSQRRKYSVPPFLRVSPAVEY